MKSTESSLKNIRFVRYGDLVMINESSLGKLGIDSHQDLTALSKDSKLFAQLKSRFRCTRIAIKAQIQDDNFRSPNVIILGNGDVGDDDQSQNPWVVQVDNGIKYTFNITKSMFCKGNINEKLRLSKLDCSNEIIVDLFAGIGYFAMVYAVHCHAQMVYCCEWNPWAVEALRRNAKLNKVDDRICVIEGDNRVVCPIGVANRVNMGLIPTSLGSLQTACKALNADLSKLYLHVHENLNYLDYQNSNSEPKSTKDQIETSRKLWSEGICSKVLETMSALHTDTEWIVQTVEVVCIKQYAPHIDHMVVDVFIRH